ncbi:4-alpha-L-fucosyltransferase [Podila minutissima]|nr:4-alpha-L-fucosyltransferase [Podila minutissima]
MFEEADIMIIDYPFFDRLDHAPYFDTLTMPPRLADQKWVFWFGGESIGSYPFVATPFYQNQFDLTMGAPPRTMDIPIPLYEITKDFALQLANTEPSFPFERKPENYVGIMVSNCDPKNNRNELIHALIDKAGAHSFGSCIHTTEMPEEFRITPTNWGDWVNNKLKMLGGYPFVFAGENSSCMGYVTEKIYNALQAGAIPIYLGAVDIADFVPEGSYVDVSKFKDFDALVDYIKTVDRSQFYKWKEVVKKDPSQFCKSCFKVEDEPWCNVIKKVTFV